ncbi:MAG: DUF4384 domain-containing protein [Alphaproteobacteria bacterium]
MFSVANKQFILPLLVAGFLAGCVTPNPEGAKVVSQPKTAPSRNITNFSESLKCMDDLFLAYGKRDIYLTTSGIPDSTGKVSAGTKEMLISALSQTSIKSKAFKFIDYDTAQGDLNQLFTDVANAGLSTMSIPSYYIRGAITQLDENAMDDQKGGSLATPFGDLGLSADQVVSLVSVDMNVGHVQTRSILPGVNASNTIAVARQGKGGDAGGKIAKLGMQISVNMNRAEGLHQAVRVLIELGLVETLGKLTEVPYWQCLQIEKTNPTVMSQAKDWYDAMQEKDRVTLAQTKLTQYGYYKGPITGAIDSATSAAIGKYQQENNLIADGRVNFDLYYALMDTKGAQIAPPPAAAAPQPAPTQKAAAVATPVTITLDSDRGPKPVYRVNDALSATVKLSGDAFLYCYYKDADGVIARVFPNRFEPDAFVAGNKPVAIPSKASTKFKIRFDRAGAKEQVACFASAREIGTRLPDALKAADLTPLGTKSMDDLASAFKTQDPTGLSQSRLDISVQ